MVTAMSPLDTSTATCTHVKREYIAANGDLLIVVEICDECETIHKRDEVRFLWREKGT